MRRLNDHRRAANRTLFTVAMLALMLASSGAVDAAQGEDAQREDVPSQDAASEPLENPFQSQTELPPVTEQRPLDDIQPIGELRMQWRPAAERLPRDRSTELFRTEGLTPSDFRSEWSTVQFEWKASEMVHQPLYWEDPWLERYGASWHPVLQPWRSGARFFLNFAAVPVKIAHVHPFEHVWTLGFGRPGNVTPCCP